MKPVNQNDTSLNRQVDFLELVTPWSDENDKRYVYVTQKPARKKGDPPYMEHHQRQGVFDYLNSLTDADAKSPLECSVYFAPALFSKAKWEVNDRQKLMPSRQQQHVHSLKSFWFDIDAGTGKQYETYRHATEALNEFADDTGMLDCGVEWMTVQSGGGLHGWIPLDQAVPLHEWQPVADQLQQLLVNRLHADPVTKNSAGLMRLPDTMNRKAKYAGGVKVVWDTRVSEPASLEAVIGWLEAVGHAPREFAPSHYNIVSRPTDPVTDKQAEKIRAGCAVMRAIQAADHPDLPYHEWWDTATLAGVSVGEILPRKTNYKAQTKGEDYLAQSLARWHRQGYRPPSCAKYAKHRPGLCDQCEFHNTRSSPADWGMLADAETELTDVSRDFFKRLNVWLRDRYARIPDYRSDDSPIVFERVLAVLNQCYCSNRENSTIYVDSQGASHIIKDAVEHRIRFYTNVAGGSLTRNEKDFAVNQLLAPRQDGKEHPDADVSRKIREFRQTVADTIHDVLWERLNAKTMAMKVDMFAAKTSITADNRNHVQIVMPFAGLREPDYWPDGATLDDMAEVYRDFREHFPQLDEVINFVVFSRFAPTRRFSFLWLHCPPGWGKTFLFDSVFGRRGLDLTYAMTTDSIKENTRGTTSGISEAGIADKWILHFDEATGNPKELKELNDHITYTPKWGTQTQTEVYAKIFTFADMPKTLLGDGVEGQMGDRFNLIRGIPAELGDRPLFAQDTERYRMLLLWYVYHRIKTLTGELVADGREKATSYADAEVRKFKATHTILNVSESLDNKLQELAEDMLVEICNLANCDFRQGDSISPVMKPDKYGVKSPHPNILHAQYKSKEYVLINNFTKLVGDFLEERGASAKISKSVHRIYDMLKEAFAVMGGEHHKSITVRLGSKTADGLFQDHQLRKSGWLFCKADFPKSLEGLDFPWSDGETEPAGPSPLQALAEKTARRHY